MFRSLPREKFSKLPILFVRRVLRVKIISLSLSLLICWAKKEEANNRNNPLHCSWSPITAQKPLRGQTWPGSYARVSRITVTRILAKQLAHSCIADFHRSLGQLSIIGAGGTAKVARSKPSPRRVIPPTLISLQTVLE